jgi:hypothetical protein
MSRDSLIREPRRGLLTQVLIAVGLCPHQNISFPQSPRRSGGQNATVQCHDCHRVLPYSWDAMCIQKGTPCPQPPPEISTPVRP